jgi:hypothetical protein
VRHGKESTTWTGARHTMTSPHRASRPRPGQVEVRSRFGELEVRRREDINQCMMACEGEMQTTTIAVRYHPISMQNFLVQHCGPSKCDMDIEKTLGLNGTGLGGTIKGGADDLSTINN